jgi:hypothetical protein
MKISFVQSGGYLGLLRGCELDTAELIPDMAQELEHIAKTSGISTSGVFFRSQVAIFSSMILRLMMETQRYLLRLMMRRSLPLHNRSWIIYKNARARRYLINEGR